jgi:sec-independent protein translocase protein TatC
MSEQEEMSFLDHLEALRWHLIRSVLAVVVGAILIFINKHFVFDVIIFGPKKADFLTYRALCLLGETIHEWIPSMMSADAICIGQNFPKLQNINMSGQFMTHISTALIGGGVVAFPYIIWELWRFIKPALHTGEKNYTRGVVFFSSLLFICGILFGYYVIAPLSINFFITYQVSEEVLNNLTLSTYISTLTTVVLSCGLVFELPIVVYFLSKVGLLTPEFLRKYRKHALVGALILSAIITPPDVFSQLLVSVPIMFLYEISIIISRFVQKKSLDS